MCKLFDYRYLLTRSPILKSFSKNLEVAKVTVTDISQLKLLFSAPVYDAGNAVLPVKDPSVNAAIVVQPVPQPIMQPI